MTIKELAETMSAVRPGGVLADELLKAGWMHNDDLAMLKRAREIVRPDPGETVKLTEEDREKRKYYDPQQINHAWIEEADGVVYRWSKLDYAYWPWFIASTGEAWVDKRVK